jgi:hypothetical protein
MIRYRCMMILLNVWQASHSPRTFFGDDNAWRVVGPDSLSTSKCSRPRLRSSSWSDDGLHCLLAHAAALIIAYRSIYLHLLFALLSPRRPLLNNSHIHHGRNAHRYRPHHQIANASLLTPRHSPRRRYWFPQGWFRRHGTIITRIYTSTRTLLRQSPRTFPTTNTPQ